MKYTDNQKKVIQCARETLIAKGIDFDAAIMKDIQKEMKATKIRVPWKLLTKNGTLTATDPLMLSALFDSVLGPSLDQFQEPDPVVTQGKPKPSSAPKEKETPKALKTNNNVETFINPVYVVNVVDCTGFGTLVGVAQSWNNTWKLKDQGLHDHGTMSESKARNFVDTQGFIRIQSNMSNHLHVEILKRELMS